MDAAALCATHPETPASFTCSRCGTFGCARCKLAEHDTVCATCAGRMAPTLAVGDVIPGAVKLLTGHPRAMLALATGQALYGLAVLPLQQQLTAATGAADADPGEVFADMATAWVALMVAGLAFSGIAYSLLIRLFGDTLERRQRPLGELLRVGLSRALPLLAVFVLVTLMVMAGSFLCLVPGLFLAVAFSIASPAVVLEPAGPLEALGISWTRTVGYRWTIALLLLVGGAALLAVTLVGVIFSVPLGALGTGGLIVSTVLSQVVTAVGSAFLQALVVLIYFGLASPTLPTQQPGTI